MSTLSRKAALAAVVASTVAAAILTGCQDRGPEIEVPSPDPALLQEIKQLRQNVVDARADYETGLAEITAGRTELGADLMEAATARLAAAAARCAQIEFCDPKLFSDSLEGLAAGWRAGEQHLDGSGQAEIAGRVSGLRSDPRAELAAAGQVALAGMGSPTPSGAGGLPELGQDGASLEPFVTFNDPTLAAMDEWLTWRRPELIGAFRNYQFLREAMAPVYTEANLPEALLFGLLATESAGKVHAYSRAGAVGPMQFMPRTALRYGLRTVDGFDTRLDPVLSAHASVEYLERQLSRLGGDLTLALAAYNGGETRLRRLHRRHPGATFWDQQIHYAVPRETRRYVPRVLAAAWLFLHPDEFGLEFPRVESPTTTLTLQQETSLGEMTICLGQHANPEGWFRTLRNLNPRLDPADRIAAGSELLVPASLPAVYARECLGGERLLARAREMYDASYPEKPPMIDYKVRSGDTLGRIAARHRCVSVRKLSRLNNVLPPNYVIHVGQRLLVPTCRR